MKIFGREPALIIGFVGAVVTVLASLNLDWLNAGQAAALTSAITAVVIAIATRPIGPSVFVAAFTAVYALVAEYGLHWSDQTIAAISGLILAGFAFFGIRPQVTPAADPRVIGPVVR